MPASALGHTSARNSSVSSPCRDRLFSRPLEQPPLKADNGSFNTINRPPRLHSPFHNSLLSPAIKLAVLASLSFLCPLPSTCTLSALLASHAKISKQLARALCAAGTLRHYSLLPTSKPPDDISPPSTSARPPLLCCRSRLPCSPDVLRVRRKTARLTMTLFSI